MQQRWREAHHERRVPAVASVPQTCTAAALSSLLALSASVWPTAPPMGTPSFTASKDVCMACMGAHHLSKHVQQVEACRLLAEFGCQSIWTTRRGRDGRGMKEENMQPMLSVTHHLAKMLWPHPRKARTEKHRPPECAPCSTGCALQGCRWANRMALMSPCTHT
eukprot:1160804-Pelagomonas_calceolata.AAC.16